MNLLKTGEARNLLMKSEKAKEVLLDAFSRGVITDDMKENLLLIQKIAVFCEREKMEVNLMHVIGYS